MRFPSRHARRGAPRSILGLHGLDEVRRGRTLERESIADFSYDALLHWLDGLCADVATCAWRINRIKRLSEFGTSLGSASATGTNRDQLVLQPLPQAVPAGVLPAPHTFDGQPESDAAYVELLCSLGKGEPAFDSATLGAIWRDAMMAT